MKRPTNMPLFLTIYIHKVIDISKVSLNELVSMNTIHRHGNNATTMVNILSITIFCLKSISISSLRIFSKPLIV